MRVTCNKDPELTQALLAQPEGMLEAHGATHFWEAVSDRLNKETNSLIVDMSGIKIMTSAGVGVLIRLLTRAKNLGGSISVYSCSDRNRTILRVSGIETLINVGESQEDSREKLRTLGVG
jgi:anti-sigma B factor antagonist